MQVQCDDNLRVTARGEAVTGGGLEVRADAVVVVELAVDDGVDAVGGGVGVEGLGAFGGEVVDGEADVA